MTRQTATAAEAAGFQSRTTPIGYVDAALGSASQTSTVFQSDSLTVTGWAADYNDNAPARSVQISVDGALVGSATIGGSRPDVAAAFNNPSWTACGWTFKLSGASLPAGIHTITATASDSLGLSSTLVTSKTITVKPPTPTGYIDSALDSASQTSTVFQSDSLIVAGWAADYSDNAPARSVSINVDGVAVGRANLGGSRSDVASAFGNPAWAASGWSFSISGASLALGAHTITATAIDSLGISNALSKPKTITVKPATPIGYIDVVLGTASQTSTMLQSDTLTVTGWAADYSDNAPARSVQVSIDGVAAGHATLGGSRADVAGAFGNPAWTASGWSFSISAAGLAVGNHTITASASDSLGVSNFLATPRTITVTPGMVATFPASFSLKSGGTATASLTTSSPAPAGGLTFSLATDDISLVSAPATITIPQGAVSASFGLNAGNTAGTTMLRAKSPSTAEADSTLSVSYKSSQVVKHVVVIFDENVSFDHYFGTYPYATNPAGEPQFVASSGTPIPAGLSGSLLTTNPNSTNSLNGAGAANPFRLGRAQAATADQDHNYLAEQLAFNNGSMNQFPYSVGNPDSATLAGVTGGPSLLTTSALTMGYFDGNTVTALWNYAQRYAMSDHFFETTFGPSTPGAINLISGQTNGVVNDVGAAGGMVSDGSGNGFTLIADPDPTGDLCSNASSSVHMTGRNVGDLLTASQISWGFFEAGFDLSLTNGNGSTGCGRSDTSAVTGINTRNYIPHHQPFQYYPSTANLNHTRPSSVQAIGSNADGANHQYDLHDFFDAMQAGSMPQVAFLKPPAYQDGHAGYSDPLDEQTFLVNTINSIQQSAFWNSTAVIVAYDDSDGWYDHLLNIVNGSQSPNDGFSGSGVCGTSTATPSTSLPGVSPSTAHAQGRCGFGPRLPLMVISPWSKANYIDSSVTDQTSIARFIEDTFLSGQRIGGGSFDAQAGSLEGMFDFTKAAAPNAGVVLLSPSTGLVTGSR